ncbi:integral membrane protein [Streptomyces sp. MMG1121]|nr:integral membrane protein [Streptomyces sp. MMG1121]
MPYAPPVGQYPATEPVPPPPIAPDGPGQVPYGYPGTPSAYGYPGGGTQLSYPGAYPAANGYGWPGMQPAPSNGLGTAALVCGILAAVGFLMWPIALVLGILAIIFGAIGRGKAKRGEATNPGMALAGLICGVAGIVLMVGFYGVVIAAAT